MLGVAEVKFKRADTVTMLPSCTYDVFDSLARVHCKRLYVETMDKEVLGVAPEALILKFSKIKTYENKKAFLNIRPYIEGLRTMGECGLGREDYK